MSIEMHTTSATIIALLKKNTMREIMQALGISLQNFTKMEKGQIAMGEKTYLQLIAKWPEWEKKVDYLDKSLNFYEKNKNVKTFFIEKK